MSEERQRCPWCPKTNGCSSCSLSGDDPNSYVLIPKSMANAQADAAVERAREDNQKIIRKWALLSSLLTGMLMAVCAALLELLLRVTK